MGRGAGRAAAALAAAWLVSGCATSGRVDVGRRIEVEDRWYGHAYRQDGERISRFRVGLALSHTAEGNRVHSAAVWAFNGALLLGGAVGCAIAATQTSGATSLALVGGAVAATAGSGWLFSRADVQLADTVRHHGATLGAARAPAPRPPRQVLFPALALEF